MRLEWKLLTALRCWSPQQHLHRDKRKPRRVRPRNSVLLPITFGQGRWSAYVGTGPGINFVHQGVGTTDISFSNFDYETSLNVFSGVRFRNGTFAEVKATLWAPSLPTLRMILGYTF